MRLDLGLGGVDRRSVLLVGDLVGGAQLASMTPSISFEIAERRRGEVARVLGGDFGQLDDRVDHRLEALVAEHHGAEHDVLGQFLGFRLDHQHGVAGAGDDEIELRSSISSICGFSTYSPLM
jgi:hypothetical protein